jgi:hypothetical protein
MFGPSPAGPNLSNSGPMGSSFKREMDRQTDRKTERQRERKREKRHVTVKYLAKIFFTHCYINLML